MWPTRVTDHPDTRPPSRSGNSSPLRIPAAPLTFVPMTISGPRIGPIRGIIDLRTSSGISGTLGRFPGRPRRPHRDLTGDVLGISPLGAPTSGITGPEPTRQNYTPAPPGQSHPLRLRLPRENTRVCPLRGRTFIRGGIRTGPSPPRPGGSPSMTSLSTCSFRRYHGYWSDDSRLYRCNDFSYKTAGDRWPAAGRSKSRPNRGRTTSRQNPHHPPHPPGTQTGPLSSRPKSLLTGKTPRPPRPVRPSPPCGRD